MAGPIAQFQKTVWDYYHAHGRDLPWRHPEPGGSFDAYKVMVSEIMLQQTQVNRVIPKYHEFLHSFPDVQSLAKASLADVLKLWSGLGYNRRAKFLHEAAKQIVKQQNSEVPKTLNALSNLPGIGHNTAAAICVYAYDQPQIFIETNIRTVYIHHFFKDQVNIADKDILPLIRSTLQDQAPRTFYWALMDYGTHLKSTKGNVSAKSRHYVKQSVFEGSRRQIRGKVLKLLIDGPMNQTQLLDKVDDQRTREVLQELENEHLILRVKNTYRIAG